MSSRNYLSLNFEACILESKDKLGKEKECQKSKHSYQPEQNEEDHTILMIIKSEECYGSDD